jgi:hydroxyacylglutathione hydrolase
MDPGWLSNAYLVADEEGGTAVFVDSGAPIEPLLEAAECWRVQPQHVLRTHGDPDHVAHEGELEATVITGSLDTGGLRIQALPTPGHSEDHLAFVVNDELCFSGDILFKDAVGGGSDVPAIRSSVMEVVMKLPPELRVLPGHTEETTIGREWEQNPFVRYWRGLEPAGDAPGRVGREEVTIVVESPDYDGKGKLLVRFADGREAIVGGSRVART